jgi:hypothetical protein
MPLPEPDDLSLSEAASRVALKCDVSLQEAQEGLIRALREYRVYWDCERGRSRERPEYVNWTKVAVDWKDSIFSWWDKNTRYQYRDIRVARNGLDVWIAESERLVRASSQNSNSVPSGNSASTRKRGRKTGDGAFDDADALTAMAKLIEQSEAKSAHEAASMVADKVRGASHQAKVDRLRRKFKASQ